jgi:hypothetical protein
LIAGNVKLSSVFSRVGTLARSITGNVNLASQVAWAAGEIMRTITVGLTLASSFSGSRIAYWGKGIRMAFGLVELGVMMGKKEISQNVKAVEMRMNVAVSTIKQKIQMLQQKMRMDLDQ